MTDESALVVAPPKKARKAAKKKEYNCDTCKLSGTKIPTIGTLETAEVLIVVEPPSPAEFKFGKPLAGRAYRLMTNSLTRTGFELTKCYFTNALLCQLPPRKDPTPTQIKSCGVNLVDKIKQMPNLKMVITCGKWPLKFFLNKSNPRAVRGELFTKNDLNIYPIYDPYYILDNIHEREVMEADLTRAKTIIDKGIRKKEIKYRLAKTLDDLREFKEILIKAKKLSFDIESRGGEFGLDLYTDKNCITTIAFTNEKMENFCIPVDHPESALLNHRNVVIETIREIMAAPSKKIAHNLKFDAKGLKLLIDVDTVNSYFDTALANSVLNKGNGDSNKLKRLAIEYLGYVNDYGIIRDDAPLDEEPLSLVAEYNAEDTENTMLLYELFKPRLKEEDLHDYFTNLMMKGCEGLADAEMNGITIDQKYGAELSDKYVTKAAELEADLRAYPEVMEMAEEAGEPFNLESPKQLSVLLFDKFKLPVFKETKTGRSTNVDTMKSLEDKHPFIPTLQLYKKSQKLVSTYLVNLTDTHLKDDGKIHCNFNQDVARTGRLSSSQPNMQNQPSKGEIGKDLKKIFISSFEGGSLIQADYSQIELRIAAIIANEKGMLGIYADDGDIHTSMASFITGKSEADVTPEERSNAKPVNFGFLYGQSPKGFVVSAKRDYGVDFTLAEATRIRARYFKMYTALEGWYEHTWAYARKTSYVKTLFGRKRTIFNLHSTNNFLKHKAENQAINCVDDQTEILTKAGWKTVYDLVPHEEIYTKNIDTGELELHPMKELKRYDDYEGPMVEINSNTFSALTTLNHRWVVDYRTGSTGNRKIKTKFVESSDLLNTNELKIHLVADGYKGCLTKKWTDDEVTLIGWVLTDGFYVKQRCPKTKKEWGNKRIGVVQSLRANPTKVAMIDKMFKDLGVKYTRDLSSKRTTQMRWVTGDELGGRIRKAFPDKQLTVEFLNELPFDQLNLLYQTMLLGDGCYGKKEKRYKTFCAGNKKINADMFSMLCSMIGISHRTYVRDMSKYTPKSSKLLNIPKMGDCWIVELKKRTRAQSGWGTSIIPKWKGLIWCPFVENSNFVARRNGIVYITGNTPVQGSAGEMCILAIYHINKYLKGKGMRSMIVNTVHDSIILDCPKEEVMQTAKIVKTIMENVPTPFDKPIPMKADIEVGPSWGALKEVKI